MIIITSAEIIYFAIVENLFVEMFFCCACVGFQAYMVESNTFYRAYGPPMEVLQQKGTVCLTLVALVCRVTSMSIARVLVGIGVLEWRCR
jgi:hypothetical protein